MSNQYGVIERIAGPTSGADIDVVLVHGLGGNALSTWEAKGPGKKITNWVTDPQFLPALLPKARIFTYGYNANLLGDRVTSRIEDHADGLRAGLLTFRRKCKNRPILWIGHSLGGLLIKRTLITHDKEYTEHIRDPSRAIIFLGTPHKGSAFAEKAWLPVARKIVAWAQLRHDIGPLIGELDPYSDTLRDTTKNFSQISLAFTIRSFFEQKPTRLPPPEGDQLIVDPSSAVMGIPTERGIPMSATHEGMCKFSSVEDDNYRILSQQIVDLATLSIEKIQEEEGNNVRLAERFLHLPTPTTQLFLGNNVTIVNAICTSKDLLQQLQNSPFRENPSGDSLHTATQAMSTELIQLDSVLKTVARGFQDNETVDIVNEECLNVLNQFNDYLVQHGNKQYEPLVIPSGNEDSLRATPSDRLYASLEGGTQALIELRKAIQGITQSNDHILCGSLPLHAAPDSQTKFDSGSSTYSGSAGQEQVGPMSITKHISLLKALIFTDHNMLLYKYAQSGDYVGVKYVLEKSQADVNVIFVPLGTPLQAAAAKGHKPIVKLLLVHGAKLNASAGKYGTALQAAAFWGHAPCVKVLLESGADVEQRGGLFGSALQAAINIPPWRVERRKEIIGMLVHFGARVSLGNQIVVTSAAERPSNQGTTSS